MARGVDHHAAGHPGIVEDGDRHKQDNQPKVVVCGALHPFCIQPDKRPDQHPAGCQHAGDHKIKGRFIEVIHLAHLFLSGIPRQQMPEPGDGRGAEYRGDKAVKVGENHLVDGIDADRREAGKEGEQDGVGIVDHHPRDLVDERGPPLV